MPLLPASWRGWSCGRDQCTSRPVARRLSVEFAATLAEPREAESMHWSGTSSTSGPPKQLGAPPRRASALPATKRARDRLLDGSIGRWKELAEKHEVAGLILEHRQVSSLKGTYVDAPPNLVGSDGRLQPRPTSRRSRRSWRGCHSNRPRPAEHPLVLFRARTPPSGAPWRGAAGQADCWAPTTAQAGPRRPGRRVPATRGSRRSFAAHSDIHVGFPHQQARALGVRGGGERDARTCAACAKMIRLRHRLWPERLRAGRPSQDPARGGAARFIADYFTACPGIRRYTVEMPNRSPATRACVAALLRRRRCLPGWTARNRGPAFPAGESAWRSTCQSRAPAADGMKIAMWSAWSAPPSGSAACARRCCCRFHDGRILETE